MWFFPHASQADYRWAQIGRLGHTPAIARLKMNDGFQLADLHRIMGN